jgi:hypothetical protein
MSRHRAITPCQSRVISLPMAAANFHIATVARQAGISYESALKRANPRLTKETPP